ncbi:MAG: hypothetical protein A4E26_02102 [Methanobacterium sp. PtaU1.Bin097]|jgi:hypothetical protein|nr:MAG: hypothetical protein A4E26_02102 [Methanobacterium sp. PtaU1.Bin097]
MNELDKCFQKHQYSFHTKPSQEELIKTIKSAQNFMDRMSRLLEN